MKKIMCNYLEHREQACIGLVFPGDGDMIAALRKQINVKWSRTNRSWYCLCSEKNLEVIKMVAAKKQYEVDDSELLLVMSARQEWPRQKAPVLPAAIAPQPKKLMTQGRKDEVMPTHISSGNAAALKDCKQLLILKGYSPSTIRTYLNELHQFMYILRERPAAEFTTARIKDYLQYCFETLKISEATIHSRINALKFFYEQLLKKEKFFWEIPRPKKRDQLPKVLSEDEIGRLFNGISNLKHKAILFTAYSAGLRVSEVVNLKLTDIDSGRMQLFIENAKGKKDRYVGLGMLLLDVLRAYVSKQRPQPVKYLFENPLFPGEPYSIRSAQRIFQDAKQKAMINKDVGIHSLRHSFATHLLEKGIDIKYIKDLLGHFSIKTTERYLHVKREQLVNIPNLLDELNKTVNLDW